MKKILSILASAVVLAMPLAVTTAQAASHTGAPMATPATPATPATRDTAATRATPATPAADKPVAKAVAKTKRAYHKGKRKAKAGKKAVVETK